MQQPSGDSSASVDQALLRTLHRGGPDSPTVAASRCPVPVEAPRDRFVALAEAGLVERVSPEPVYRITEDGHQRVVAGNGSPQSVTGD